MLRPPHIRPLSHHPLQNTVPAAELSDLPTTRAGQNAWCDLVSSHQDNCKAHLPQAVDVCPKRLLLGSQEARDTALSIHTLREGRYLLQQLVRPDLLCHGCQAVLPHLCFQQLNPASQPEQCIPCVSMSDLKLCLSRLQPATVSYFL